MKPLLDWLKQNKPFALLLVLFVGYWLYTNRYNFPIPYNNYSYSDYGYDSRGDMAMTEMAIPSAGMNRSASKSFMPPIDDYPVSDPETRLVSRNANLSIQVSDVPQSLRDLESQALNLGGFLINQDSYNPEGAASGSITVRVPTTRLNEFLASTRGLAIKVVNESVYSQDITDEYTDINERLATYETTKARFQQLFNQANRIEDLLLIQQELVNVQSQIDSLKGRQMSLEKQAELSLVSVYVSTDEFSLPYTPDQPWRPDAIFKNAIRSLISHIRTLGTLLIWTTVYTPIWLPVLGIGYYLRRRSYSSPMKP